MLIFTPRIPGVSRSHWLDAESIAAKASEGLSNVSVNIDLEVLCQMMEVDVTELTGNKEKHNPNRTAYRHGSNESKVIFGSGKVSITRVCGKAQEISMYLCRELC